MQSHEFRSETLPQRQRGLTTVEYAVAGGLLVAGVVVAFTLLGGGVKGVVDAITSAL